MKIEKRTQVYWEPVVWQPTGQTTPSGERCYIVRGGLKSRTVYKVVRPPVREYDRI